MRFYTLWHKGDDGDMPWLVDAVDEFTVDNLGELPPDYLKRRADTNVRELLIEVPDEAVKALFEAPAIKAKVVDSSKL